ncbi:Attachment invasion locus protein precursor [Xenorhabdus sp. Reich]|uniref:Attachment invasion locus protein n=1 Tax=Xenorhabdus littoralis TaxID=2582835 RepID=A0ABU4SKZ2_9GAMM|nr:MULTISPECIES: Ail/Lom family outer membrane beta-barrel protein [unclassified Xenorhabdus]MDX7991400.1 Attachment invasion locus protein precursor [Xenorhabdus sp. psl]MDX7999293.1 Attachment invasion locus protein precursor [Xenorhabdus sp. Reich]
MKKALLVSAIAAGLSISSFTANANNTHTISLGYAQTNTKLKSMANKEVPLKDPRGLNLKYRYEINDNWGVIGSVTQTKLSLYYAPKPVDKRGRNADETITYRSLMAGSTYRFNDYMSAYTLLGVANIEDHQKTNSNTSEKKTALAYGAGLQFNPISNVAVDVAYEYSHLKQAKAGTWTIGVGYHF